MGEQFDKASGLNEIVKAARSCKKGVSRKDGPMEFFITALGSGERLQREIRSGRYHARPGTPVEIWRPKHRTAAAPWFRDRVWQRSMCDNGVYDDLVRGFIPENMACQKGKGTDLAIRTVIRMLQELCREAPGAPIWGRHLDVRKYFPSTPQAEIKALDSARITEPKFLPYLFEIIDMQKDPRSAEEITADPFGKRGTGLGSQINQLNQVALLDGLDHEIKDICPCYIRYNDDFLFLHHDREAVQRTAEIVEARLHEKGLEMQDKCGLFKLPGSFCFLRKKFILTESGKIILRLHPKALSEERQTLRNLKHLVREGKRTMQDVRVHYQSWVSNAEYAGDAPIREMDRFYTELFRQKPEYKRKRRYLYGHRTDAEKENPHAGGRKRGEGSQAPHGGSETGVRRHDGGR